MAHYAWINLDNIVINVTVGSDEDIIQQGIGGTTEAWEEFYTNSINQEGVYVKRTSYNTHAGVNEEGGTAFRKNYAGIGYTYDPIKDAFIPPKFYSSWILNEDTCRWDPPTPMPEDGKSYIWNEDTLSWEEIPAII